MEFEHKLPHGWQSKTLGELATITSGGTPSRTIRDYWENGHIPWFSSGELNTHKINNSNEHITIEGLNNSTAKIFPIGTLLVGMYDTAALKMSILDVEAAFNQAIVGVNPKNDIVNNQFLKYQLEFLRPMVLTQRQGIRQQNLNTSKIRAIQINYPSKLEQTRIVAKLDALFERIDKAIALLEGNIKRTGELMGAVLGEVFSKPKKEWKKKRLDSFDTIQAGGTPARNKKEYWGGEIPWFISRELNTHTINESVEKITEEGLKNSSAKLFPKGTLLVGMYDTAALKMSILEIDAACNQAIVGIKPKEDVLNIEFLKYQLEFLRPMVLTQRQGVRQQNLNASKIRSIEIQLPTIDEQLQIVNFIKSVSSNSERLLKAQIQKLHHLQALKSSLLDRAFRGEL